MIKKKLQTEAIKLGKATYKGGEEVVAAYSDLPNTTKASNETWKVKDIFKKYGGDFDDTNKKWVWYLTDENKVEILNKVNLAVKEANIKLGNASKFGDFKSIDDIKVLADAKNFLETVKKTLDDVKKTSNSITIRLVEDYIDSLADSLDDKKLIDDIVNFNKLVISFKNRVGAYTYGPNNLFLIWLQITKGATQVGPPSYWLGRGYKPKENAKQIFISKPSGESMEQTIKKLLEKKPYLAREFQNLTKDFVLKDSENPIPKEKQYAFTVWARKNGHLPKYKPSRKFETTALFDNLNVEPKKGLNTIEPPEEPKWYADDNEDEKAIMIINALLLFASNNGIKITDSENLDGARGVSKNGHIQLLTSSKGVGRLSVLVHELAHELMHQPIGERINNGKLYVGKKFTKGEIELHAESVAFIVLKSYNFPIKHSLTYLALWKQNKESVKKFQEVIRDASLFIIKQIEDNMDGESNNSDFNQTLNEIKLIINNFKKSIYG
jgi:hypothetical protein